MIPVLMGAAGVCVGVGGGVEGGVLLLSQIFNVAPVLLQMVWVSVDRLGLSSKLTIQIKGVHFNFVW